MLPSDTISMHEIVALPVAPSHDQTFHYLRIVNVHWGERFACSLN